MTGARLSDKNNDSLTDQQNRRVGAVVLYLRAPLGRDVLEGGGADDREADEEDIRLRVGQRPQAIIVFLASCVPKAQRYGHAVAHLTWVHL